MCATGAIRREVKMDQPKIAVVGMGGFALAHRRYVKQVEDAGLGRQIAQVAIPADQEAFADDLRGMTERGIAVYGSLREMLGAERERIDVVCIPTGIPLHRPMAVAALEAGCHVLVEKPAAGSIQDVDAMLAAERRSGKQCAVGFQHLYRSDIQQVKDWICQGRLGRIERITAFGCWPRNPDYYGRNGWAGRLAVGDTWVLDSPHNNALAHAVNAMCYLGSNRVGETVTPVGIQAELYRANDIESADTVALRLRSAEGVEIFFAVSHCTDQNIDPTFVISAEKGILELGYGGGIRIQWQDGQTERWEMEREETRVLEDVVEVIAGKRQQLACPLAVARAHTLCVSGTFESSAIHNIPKGVCEVDAKKDGIVVKGMTEIVQRASREAALFSELGVEWARPGDEIDLRGYAYFPTFRRRVGE